MRHDAALTWSMHSKLLKIISQPPETEGLLVALNFPCLGRESVIIFELGLVKEGAGKIEKGMTIHLP